jgi:hypothetical protein
MKRVPDVAQIDDHYLFDVFIQSYGDQNSRSVLSNSVSQLYADLAEFRDVMHQVEVGKIPVEQGMKGDWGSFSTKDGAWIGASYEGREGVVIDFQKHKNQDPYPLIYAFRFYTNGCLLSAETQGGRFDFDEHGRVLECQPRLSGKYKK